MFNTRITEMLGIEYPIIQGAMQWLSRAELVAAVSNAGGLGVLSAITFPTAEELGQDIRKTKSLTNKPFAVNVSFMPTARPVIYEEYLSTAIEEGVTIVEANGRIPEPCMKLLKDAKVKIIQKVGRVKDAQKAEQLGVDAVTAIGFETGGHLGRDDISSLVIIPMAVDSV